MNWRTTWILLAVAVGLFLYIALLERHLAPTTEKPRPPAPLLPLEPKEVTHLQIRRAGELFLQTERTNGGWQLTFPLAYPAQAFAIAGWLEQLHRLRRATFLTPEDLDQAGQTLEAFQLKVPAVQVILSAGEERVELNLGSKTPVGDGVYVQVPGSPNVFVVQSEILDRLPREPTSWRDPSLVDLRRIAWNRLEMRGSARTYTIELDPTNRTFVLTQPTPARANRPKILALLGEIQNARVIAFVEDDPGADLEPYGLANPQAELVFGRDTNDLVSLRFGHSPTNDPGSLYVWRSQQTNVVQVPASLLASLQVSHAELREKRLLTVLPETVDRIQVLGQTNLVLQRVPQEGWKVIEPFSADADAELVQSMFAALEDLEGEVERDVVTDFSVYGLAPPALRYRLYATLTNRNGRATNQLVGGLDFGLRQEGRVYVRRIDEQSVYSVPQTEFEQVPQEGWQLRHRQVWSFSTNQVTRVTVEAGDGKVEMLRTGPARWELASGSQGILNDLAVEETVYRLGRLEADFWLARGAEEISRYGFDNPEFSLTFDLEGAEGEKVERRVVFGQASPNQFPHAMTVLDGEPVIFEFPKKLYLEMVRDLLRPFIREPLAPQ